MAGVNIVLIPYKSTAQGLADVIAGQVQVLFSSAGSASPYVKSGRLRVLAVTSAQPSALLPGLPTVAASGVPDYQAGTSTGIFAPAGTPAAIINRLNQELVRVLNKADVKERFLGAGTEAVSSSPEQLSASVELS
jgi:tripartite-type tricarboxylate transporter receptor subunit TctC